MQLTEHNKPWYSYPLVWMMVSIPLSAVVMGVVMIWLAIDTDDGLVADDYYKQGLEINSVILRDQKAAELGLSAVIEFDNTSKVINLRFNKGGLADYPATLQLNLQHATRANSDIPVLLNRGIDGQYIGRVNQPVSKGIWYFELVDADWKLNVRTRVKDFTVIELKPI